MCLRVFKLGHDHFCGAGSCDGSFIFLCDVGRISSESAVATVVEFNARSVDHGHKFYIVFVHPGRVNVAGKDSEV